MPNGEPVRLKKNERYLHRIKGQVAQVLLDHAGDISGTQNRLTHRDMAAMLNTDWNNIHSSLQSLSDEGAIKIDRHRIIIEAELLQKAASGAHGE
jgi:hypothetical protein